MEKKSKVTPEQKALLNLESKYNARLWRIYSTAADEAALLGASVDGSRLTEEAFTFDDFPGTKKRVDGLLKELHTDVRTHVVDGVRASWELADEKNDALVREVFGDAADRLTDEQKARYFSNSDRALESFLSRKVNGMNLSQRVWRYTMEFRENIETVLDVGIREGKAAPEMASDLKRYLKYPDKLFRRVRGTDGRLHLSRPARAFHPGQGVYRSSYMNALRLSATENNIAYRTSDFTRIQSLDFVVGIRIRLSNNHTLKNPRGGAPIPLYDICDELKGDYPKDFKFTGWHPFCRCHAETILKTREEMDEGIREILNGRTPSSESVNSVRDIPDSFRGWVERNGGRIAAAKKLPYFLEDNAEKYLPGVRFTKAARVQIREAGKLMEADKPNRKQVRLLYSEWCQNHLTNVKMRDGSVAKRMTIKAQDKDIIVNKGFFDETFSKCTRGDDFVDVIDAALHIEEWLPSAELSAMEKGVHHNFNFLVYNAKYKGIDIELKVKVTDGLFAYFLKKK